MSPRLPDFLIIGGMKCGSTTLFQYLCRHPRIFMPTPKEPQFFSRDHVYFRGESWYRNLFAPADAEQLCGEASTCYTRWPTYDGVPARIRQLVPDVKLLYIMRHPVDRIYSHYLHTVREHVKHGRPFELSLDEAIERDPEYVSTSLYLRQIERYLECFRRDRLLCLTVDELKSEPAAVLARAQEFLGLPVLDLVRDEPVVANERADDRRLVEYGLDRLVWEWRHATGIRRVADLVPKPWRHALRAQARRWAGALPVRKRVETSIKQKTERMRPETRRMLLQKLETPTRELERFLQRDLGRWYA